MSRFLELVASHYSGCGNDFLLIDNRQENLPEFSPDLISQMCQPEKGTTIDGLIIVGSSKNADVSMKFYNCDGKEAEMCGNGVRCLMQYLRQKLSYPRTRCLLETKARDLLIRFEDDEIIVHMGPVQALEWNVELVCGKNSYLLQHINSGVPHVVVFVPDVDQIDVQEIGAFFRSHPHFGPAGTNVNFVTITSQSPHRTAKIRTFERGVERETLACGTGVCATGYVLQKLYGFSSPIAFQTRSSEWLQVDFELQEGEIDNLTLRGPVKWIRDLPFSIDATTQRAETLAVKIM